MSDSFEQGEDSTRASALEEIISRSITSPRLKLCLNYIDVQRLLAVPSWGVSPASVEAVKKLENAYEIIRIADRARTSNRPGDKDAFRVICYRLADYMAFLGRTSGQRRVFFSKVGLLVPNMICCNSIVQPYEPKEEKKDYTSAVKRGGNHHRMVFAR
jgi:hypothetical protein